ncbi:transcript variant X2, partial [Nothobranchius furzeri]
SASPTVPPLHSEHFKPCHEKDLAYCLNGGECFVIETLSGPHKHCKCREGYQGIRCDQFLPKTDSILSDPNHLGIEFMESKAVYKRQVLSITSIAMAISLLGTLCMALYCRNKRRREKLQAQLKESRSLKNYTTNSNNPLEEKMKIPNTNLHEYCKRPSMPRQGNICESSFAHCSITGSSRVAAKHHRSGSLSHSPDQKTRSAHWSAPRRTPPIHRGRLNPIGGSKYSGPAYQHLQEVDPSEKEPETQKGVDMQGENQGNDSRQDAFVHMQTPAAMETPSALPWCGRDEVFSGPRPLPHLNSHRSLRKLDQRHSLSPPPPFRSCSIPIIPSVQCHHDSEESCMQTSPETTEMSITCSATPCKQERREMSARARLFSSSCSSAVGQDEVALLLEEAQEQLRALAHRKQEEGGIFARSTAMQLEARETVCFLNLNGGTSGGLSYNGPMQTQLLSQPHRDSGQSGQ